MKVFCLQPSPGEEEISVDFCPIPQKFSRFLFDPVSKSLGLSRTLTSRKANGKCIIP